MNSNRETKDTNSKTGRQQVRKSYIQYFAQNPEARMNYTLRQCVRMLEIVKCGAQLRNYYPHLEA